MKKIVSIFCFVAFLNPVNLFAFDWQKHDLSHLVVVTNRRGLWAQVERTPFGWGRPYSQSQLSRLLRANMFTPTRSAGSLFVPPTRSRALLRSAAAWERVGTIWFPRFAGVLLVEAGKRLYSPSAVSRRVVRRRPIVVPLPQVARRLPRETPS